MPDYIEQAKRLEKILEGFDGITKSDWRISFMNRINSHKRDRCLDVIESYNSKTRRNVYNAIEFSQEREKVLEIFDDKHVRDSLHCANEEGVKLISNSILRIPDHEYTKSLIGLIELYDSDEGKQMYKVMDVIHGYSRKNVGEEAIDFFTKYHGRSEAGLKVIHSLLRRINKLPDFEAPDKTGTVLKVLEKYLDNKIEKVAGCIYKNLELEHLLCYLSNDDTYERIKKTRNINKLVQKEVVSVIESISDREFSKKVTLKDLYPVISTYRFVLEIHRKRSVRDLEIIQTGYYREMNRVISQTDDYESKVRNLHEYAKEVKKNIMDNASELMLVR